MDGFVALIHDLLIAADVPNLAIHTQESTELPGYFRAEKRWDVVILSKRRLVACLEFKSQIGPSFGNNFNNRSEEAIGNATDLWTAFREGAFETSARPWLGYLMLLEESPKSTAPVGVREPHFPVFREFHEASYVQRYQLLLTRLVRERLYDSACLLTSSVATGRKGTFREPSALLGCQQFVVSLTARAMALSKL